MQFECLHLYSHVFYALGIALTMFWARKLLPKSEGACTPMVTWQVIILVNKFPRFGRNCFCIGGQGKGVLTVLGGHQETRQVLNYVKLVISLISIIGIDLFISNILISGCIL